MPNDALNHKHTGDQLLDASVLGRLILRIASGTGVLTSNGTVVSWGAGGAAIWRTGSGVPDNSLGGDGDMYLNTANGDTYNKVTGAWVFVSTIVGAPGADGSVWYTGHGYPTGYLDPQDYYLDVDTGNVYSGTSYVLVGNIKGAPGTDGSVWYTGTGAPGSGTGQDGDYYLEVTTGDVYYRTWGSWVPDPYLNIKGPKGDPGDPASLTHNKMWIGNVSNVATAVTPSGDATISDTGVVTVASTIARVADVHVKHGFENRTDSNITFTATSPTRTVQIAPASTTFSYWRGGTKVTKNSAQTATITNTIGLWYVYFNTSDVLTTSQTSWDIESDNVPVCALYWNGTSARIQEERHGYIRNRSWHKWAHDTIGTRYESGLVGTFTNTTLAFTEGYVHDEDIDFYIGAQTNCVLWYKLAASGKMEFLEATTPYKSSAGALQYDNNGTPTAVGSGKHVVNDVYASLSLSRPIYVRVGMAEYTTLADARAAVQATWTNATSNELKLLYRVIYKNNGGTINFVEATDYRSGGSVPQGGTPAISPHASTHDGTGSDPILNLGEVTFSGSAPAIPAVGKVAIGGGLIALNSNNNTRINIDSAGNNSGFALLESGVPIWSLATSSRTFYFFSDLHGVSRMDIDDNGVTSFYGNIPTAPAAGVTKIGGGQLKLKGTTTTRISIDSADSNAGFALVEAGTPVWSLATASKVFYFWSDYHSASRMQIADNGVVSIFGDATTTVGANEVNIGGGILRAYGSIYTNGGVINPTAATWLRCYDGADLTSLELDAAAGTVTIKGAGGALPASLTAGTAVIADGAAAFSGAAPTAGVAGEVRIGGGRVVACVGAGGLHLQPIALNNSLILDNSRYDVGASGFKALSTGYGSYLQFASDGALYFANAPSVAAGAGQTFTTRFTVQADGTVVCVGAAPSSVSAGEVRIGGGIIRTAGEIWAGANLRMITSSSIGYVQGYNGAAYNELKLMGEKVTIDSVGSPLYVLGTAPSTASAGEVRIGGGALYAAGAIHAGTYIEANGSSPFFQLAQAGVAKTYFQWDNANTRTEYYSAGTHYFTISKVQIVTTADGALTVGGKITAKAAVPASFANLAAVQTYLASILT